ncbi:hypothetical protein V6N11_036790 [Hibiscus sabdariffa]|uniref:Uncharacterized protein n=1 Tax=Hibiscus sabdariffa TaxID=183260 RepID=A0ABR2RBQ9_9ROSI
MMNSILAVHRALSAIYFSHRGIAAKWQARWDFLRVRLGHLRKGLGALEPFMWRSDNKGAFVVGLETKELQEKV